MEETNKRDLEQIVDLYIPYNEADRKDKSVIISVNGRPYQLDRGVANKVPLFIKLEYERQQQMIADRNAFIENVKNEMTARQRETGMRI